MLFLIYIEVWETIDKQYQAFEAYIEDVSKLNYEGQMIITFSVVLLGILAICRPLQRNPLYMLHCALVIGAAYYVENNMFKVTPFAPKTFLLLIVFHLVFINITTFIAYWLDKRAAKKGAWRISEKRLHQLELMGGILGAFLGQVILRHKSNKKEYKSVFVLIIILQASIVLGILKFLSLI
ncbi:MAG: DUF1294 domain-containing protein [Lactobacillus sp.]|nr:DUF1294 domain-containing protein [Lactobacillus sp.]